MNPLSVLLCFRSWLSQVVTAASPRKDGQGDEACGEDGKRGGRGLPKGVRTILCIVET